MTLSPLILLPIGTIRSPYGEKFAVPRQPNLVQEGYGVLELVSPYNSSDAVRGLADFSHLWLIFQFHQIPDRNWHATVRPPRLGGNKRVGVFASRATHRPNPIGLSKVELKEVSERNGQVTLMLGSVDLVDGTPILDIKPYIGYADSEPFAKSSFAQEKPPALLQVQFTQQSLQAVRTSKKFAQFGIQNPIQFIIDVIAQDPRPAYQQGKLSDRIYGMNLAGYNIRWLIDKQDPYLAWVISVM